MKDGVPSKNIYLGNELVAMVEDGILYHVHTDHLGSTNAITGPDGHTYQVLAYYPYGEPRIDERYGALNQTNRYTGHDYDEETGLNYMKARMQSGVQGRFLSQDPAVLGRMETLINDPQLLQPYGYARNNPLIYTDPTGEVAVLAAPASLIVPVATGLVVAGAGVAAISLAASIAADTDYMVSQTPADSDFHITVEPTPYEIANPIRPEDPSDWRPPHDNQPKWRIIVGSIGAGALIYEEYIKPIFDNAEEVDQQLEQAQSDEGATGAAEKDGADDED